MFKPAQSLNVFVTAVLTASVFAVGCSKGGNRPEGWIDEKITKARCQSRNSFDVEAVHNNRSEAMKKSNLIVVRTVLIKDKIDFSLLTELKNNASAAALAETGLAETNLVGPVLAAQRDASDVGADSDEIQILKYCDDVNNLVVMYSGPGLTSTELIGLRDQTTNVDKVMPGVEGQLVAIGDRSIEFEVSYNLPHYKTKIVVEQVMPKAKRDLIAAQSDEKKGLTTLLVTITRTLNGKVARETVYEQRSTYNDENETYKIDESVALKVSNVFANSAQDTAAVTCLNPSPTNQTQMVSKAKQQAKTCTFKDLVELNQVLANETTNEEASLLAEYVDNLDSDESGNENKEEGANANSNGDAKKGEEADGLDEEMKAKIKEAMVEQNKEEKNGAGQVENPKIDFTPIHTPEVKEHRKANHPKSEFHRMMRESLNSDLKELENNVLKELEIEGE